jgi:hypothetical protein
MTLCVSRCVAATAAGIDSQSAPSTEGGDDIPEEIRRQIKLSREIVILLTPESIDRRWVLLEVGAAWG